jgi:hypothetical protein
MFGRNFTGRGRRGGSGLGFRGSSPPWPYVGRGRGGLPRCGYYSGSAGAREPRSYQSAPFYSETPFAPRMSREQELEFLKSEAQALRDDLKELETEIGRLSAEKE